MLLLLVSLVCDGVSDFVFSLYLLSEDSAGWGGGLLACLLLPALLLPLYCLVSRCTRIQQRVTLSDLLVVSPYIHSAPAATLQLMMIWWGVRVTSFSWRWCQYLSLLLSLASLSLASLNLQEEPGPRARRISSGLNILAGCLLRTSLISLIFTFDPTASTLFLAAGYLFHLLYHCSAADGHHSIFLAFCNLFIPTGQNHQMCPTSEQMPSTSELERVKLNEKGLHQRRRRFLTVSVIYNTLLSIFYLVIVEVRPATSMIELLRMRSFTLTVPLLLYAASLAFTYIYYQQARLAAESESEVTPPKSPSTPMRCESRDVERGAGGSGDTSGGGGLYPALPSAPPSVPDPPYNPSYLTVPVGNKRCDNQSCVTCTRMVEGPDFSSSVTGLQYTIHPAVSCTNEKLIYLITCRRCQKQYVGKTEQSLRQRHYGHRREIEVGSSALGQHFSQSQCGAESLNIQIIEVCTNLEELPAREGAWQHLLKSFAPSGINIRDELGGKLKS